MKRPGQVNRQVPLPRRLVGFRESGRFDDPGIVHQNIWSATEPVPDTPKGAINASRIANITFYREGLRAAFARNLSGYAFDLRTCPGGHGNVRPFARECDRDRASNAPSTAGDERKSILQFHRRIKMTHRGGSADFVVEQLFAYRVDSTWVFVLAGNVRHTR
jgi:hypothetical protein